MNAKETKEQKKLSVTKNMPEERIDQFLAKKIPDFSRSRLQKLIKGKQVLIKNKSITSASYKIKPGDFIVVNIPKASEGKLKATKIALEILYEDQDIIVINKPAGLVVHPGAGNWENTLVNALLAHCGNNLSGIGGVRRPGIVHRLDKETSGALVVAKNDYAHINLSKQFSDRKIMRSYQAIVWGWLGKTQGTFKGNLGRNPKNRKNVLKTLTYPLCMMIILYITMQAFFIFLYFLFAKPFYQTIVFAYVPCATLHLHFNYTR